MKKIGVISDTHGLLRPEVKKIFKDCDLIIHAGDVGKSEILSSLSTLAPIHVVRGNADYGKWCARIFHDMFVEVEKTLIYVVHDDALLNLDPQKAGIKVVISGHTHIAKIKKHKGILYFNPGSAGPRRYMNPITVGMMLINKDEIDVEIKELDVPLYL